MEENTKKFDALFNAVEKVTVAETREIEVAGVKLEVTQMTMKMFTEFALETSKSSNGDSDEVKKANANGAMIQLLARRIVKITVGDVVIETSTDEEREEVLSGTIMRMTGDDVGELLDRITEAVGLGKMLQMADSKA